MARRTPAREASETTGAPQVPIEELLTLATRAPSIQNTQPWAWRWDGRELLLRADPLRRVWRADPSGRDMVISCGAALHHLQVAAAGLGWRAEVRREVVTLGGRPLAAVTFTPEPSTSVEERALLRAIEERRTDRRPRSSWSVPPSRMEALAAEGRAWGVLTDVVEDQGTRARLAELTAAAEGAQQADRFYRGEESSLPGTSLAHGGGLRPAPHVDPRWDQLLVFSTASDDVLSWLRTGEALSAVWLRAVREGLTLVPLTQGVEVEPIRSRLKDDVLDDRRRPQLLALVGWPPEGRMPVPRTPRRPVRDVLTQRPGWRDTGSAGAGDGPT